MILTLTLYLVAYIVSVGTAAIVMKYLNLGTYHHELDADDWLKALLWPVCLLVALIHRLGQAFDHVTSLIATWLREIYPRSSAD